MTDLFDYLTWRGDLSFTASPLNPVDTLLFSELSYLDLNGLVPGDFQNPVSLKAVAEAFLALPEQENRVRVKKDIDLLAAAAQTERFGNLQLLYFRDEFLPEMESQFAAVTFLLPDGSAVLAFRGTDYTLAGWKEDFNMSFQEFVPAQEKALLYTRAFMQVHPVPVWLCGHSKGGNLAVYTAIKSQPEHQERMLGIFNHDGPGFTQSTLSDPDYRSMVPKIHTFLPQSSVIGMLLEHEEPFTIIKSRQVSLLQHDPYSWEVLGRDFVPAEGITGDSRFVNQTIKTWLATRTMQQRNEFVDAVYELLTAGEVDDAREIILPWNVLRYVRTLGEDKQMRELLLREFTALFRTASRLRRQEEPTALPESEIF